MILWNMTQLRKKKKFMNKILHERSLIGKTKIYIECSEFQRNMFIIKLKYNLQLL